MNSFSAKLYFEICIIVFITCFKKRRISVFAILSEILLALSQKESSPRSLCRVLLMARMLYRMFGKPVSLTKRKGEENLMNCVNHLCTKGKAEDQGLSLAELQN